MCHPCTVRVLIGRLLETEREIESAEPGRPACLSTCCVQQCIQPPRSQETNLLNKHALKDRQGGFESKSYTVLPATTPVQPDFPQLAVTATRTRGGRGINISPPARNAQECTTFQTHARHSELNVCNQCVNLINLQG